MSSSELRVRLPGRLVTLEPLGREHADELFSASQEPEIWTWMPEVVTESRQRFDAWLERTLGAAASGCEAPFAIVANAPGLPVGSTRFLEIRLEHARIEIGWTWLAKEMWQTGANAEAKLLLMEHAFDRLGVHRVEFKTDARNERSRRALEALPAQFEGVFRKHMLVRDGKRRDSAYYSVIDDDWPEVRANLERRLERNRDRLPVAPRPGR